MDNNGLPIHDCRRCANIFVIQEEEASETQDDCGIQRKLHEVDYSTRNSYFGPGSSSCFCITQGASYGNISRKELCSYVLRISHANIASQGLARIGGR